MFLTICVLTYNRHVTLVNTLESLVPQVEEFNDAEILVLDNHSSDGTAGYLNSLLSHVNCLRVLRHEKNIGFDGNVVAAVSNGSGSYIWFFSDDDVAPAGTVRVVVETLREKTPKILYLNHASYNRLTREQGRPLGESSVVVSSDGVNFIGRFGLGFISCLILKKDQAQKCQNFGEQALSGQAHLELAFRIALSYPGYCVYLGDQIIFAGVPDVIADDYFTAHRFNVHRLLIKLGDEGRLPRSWIESYIRRSALDVLKSFAYRRGFGNFRKESSQMRVIRDTYNAVWWIYPCVVLIHLTPRSVIKLFVTGLKFARVKR